MAAALQNLGYAGSGHSSAGGSAGAASCITAAKFVGYARSGHYSGVGQTCTYYDDGDLVPYCGKCVAAAMYIGTIGPT